MTEPKASRTVKGKIISNSVGKFQDGDKSDSLKPASKVPECPYTDEKLYEAYCAGQNSLIQGGWKSPSEVEALIKDERAKVSKFVLDYLRAKVLEGSIIMAETRIIYLEDNLKKGVLSNERRSKSED